MAEITKAANATISSVNVPASMKLSGKIAGENIGDCDACRVHTDGKIYRSNGAANDANAVVDGFSMKRAKAGQPVTLIDHPVNFRYATGLTPGKSLFLSGTVPGGLADAASTGGLKVIARTIDPTRIRIKPQI